MANTAKAQAGRNYRNPKSPTNQTLNQSLNFEQIIKRIKFLEGILNFEKKVSLLLREKGEKEEEEEEEEDTEEASKKEER
mgnify:CR=1 FL=1